MTIRRTLSTVLAGLTLAVVLAVSPALATSVGHPFTLHQARTTIQRTVRQVFRDVHLANLTPRVQRCYWSTPIVATCVLHGPSLISSGEHTYRLHFGISDIYS